jgi:AraC-like DNA-binding protein
MSVLTINHAAQSLAEGGFLEGNSRKTDADRRQEIYEGKDLLLPELTVLGWLHFKRALPHAIRTSIPAHTVEIVYMVAGHVSWWIDGERFVLKGGDAMIIAPGCTHGAEALTLQRCEHYWLRFHYPVRTFTGVSVETTKALLNALKTVACNSWSIGAECEPLFRGMIGCHRNQGPFASLQVQALFQLLLVQIISHATSMEVRKPELLPQAHFRAKIDRAMALLDQEHLESAPSVGQMARVAGLKEATFRRVFERYVGMTPAHFIASRRVSKARKFLTMGQSVTEVAYKLGFSSSQYFATVFKQWTGLQPSEFVRNNHKTETRRESSTKNEV